MCEVDIELLYNKYKIVFKFFNYLFFLVLLNIICRYLYKNKIVIKLMRVCIDNLENAATFTMVFQHIKNFADFINMTISEEKLYIQAMDTSKISVFEVKLMPSFFSTFELSETETIGINVPLFHKILSVRNKAQKINLVTEIGGDKLDVSYTSDDVSIFNKDLQIPLVDIDEELFGIPEMEYNVGITLASSKFSDIINDLKLFDDTFTINCEDEKVVIGSEKSESGKMSVTLNQANMKEYTKDDDLNASYALRMLIYVTIYSKIIDEVKFELSDGVPLKITYKVDSVGSQLMFHLAPKIND